MGKMGKLQRSREDFPKTCKAFLRRISRILRLERIKSLRRQLLSKGMDFISKKKLE